MLSAVSTLARLTPTNQPKHSTPIDIKQALHIIATNLNDLQKAQSTNNQARATNKENQGTIDNLRKQLKAFRENTSKLLQDFFKEKQTIHENHKQRKQIANDIRTLLETPISLAKALLNKITKKALEEKGMQ